VFKSREHAESYLEPMDVRDGVYPRAYDATGRLFQLVVNPPKGFCGVERTALKEVGDGTRRPEELQRKLVDTLTKLGVDLEWLSKAGNSELIQEALKFAVP